MSGKMDGAKKLLVILVTCVLIPLFVIPSPALGQDWLSYRPTRLLAAVPVLSAISNPECDGNYTVDWNDVAGATSYHGQEAQDPGFTVGVRDFNLTNSQIAIADRGPARYYYRVASVDGGGESGWSNTESVCVCPATPTLNAISNPEFDGDYTVDWSDVAGAITYTLQTDDNALFASPTEVYTSASQYAVSGQATGIWYYRVKAVVGAACESGWSGTQFTAVYDTLPVLNPISNPDCDGAYTVDWDDVPGTISYDLEEDDDPAFGSPTVRYSGTNTDYAVSGQAAGRWYYRVHVYFPLGIEDYSNTESVCVCPAIPTISPISNPECDGDYIVDWSDVTGATSYLVQESSDPIFATDVRDFTTTSSQWARTARPAGQSYYRVKAVVDGTCEGDWSATQSVCVCSDSTFTLDAVSNPECDGTYTVTWSAMSCALSYTLEEDDNAAFSSPTTVYSGANTEHVVTGQATGCWYYRAKFATANGESSWSASQRVRVCATSLTLYAIDNTDCNGAYTVDWSDVAGISYYLLEESASPTFDTSNQYATGPSNSYYNITGKGGGRWYYRVQVVFTDGPFGCTSDWSNVQTADVCPSPPTLNPISNPECDGTYLVDWETTSSAISYTLQEDDNGSFTSPVVVYSGAYTEHLVSGQAAGSWYYRVKATSIVSDTAWSVTQGVSVCSTTGPILNPISNPDCDGDYTVDWDAVTGAISYTLQEDDNASFSSPTLAYSGTNTDHDVGGQAAGVWYYRVRAADAGGDGAWSATEAVTVCATVIAINPISNPDCDGAYTVDWDAVTGAVSYDLEEDDNPAFGSPVVRYSGTMSEYAVSGQSLGHWYYRVHVYYASGDVYSNIEDVCVCPAAPILYAIVNADCDGAYTVDWDPAAGATSYVLEEDTNPAFGNANVVYSGSNTEHTYASHPAGHFYYRVKALFDVTCESAWSTTQDACVCPAAPTLNVIDNVNCDGDYTVDWEPVTVAGGANYVLEVDDNAAFTSPTEAYSGTDPVHVVTGQATGTWYYRVKAAADATCESAWSGTQSVDVCPDAPTLNAISNADCDGAYTVDWEPVAGATAYTLEEDDNASFSSPTTVYSGANTDHAVSGQTPGTWHYRVRATNAAGDSAWSGTRSVDVCSPALTLNPISNPDCDGNYTVDWDPVIGALLYTLQRDDNPAFGNPAVVYLGLISQHNVSGQGTGRWYYRVRATTIVGNSAWSTSQDVSVCPDAPTLYAIDNANCDGDYTVDWSSATGATSYTLEEDDNAAFSSPTTVYSGSDTDHAVSGQGTGRWYYRVRASNAGGDSPWSGTQDVGVCPAAPTLYAISNPDCDGDYTVDWGAATGATSYTLEEDDNAAFSSPTTVYSGS
ncbi:MAG: hypothetical protein KKA73_05660, partial [Chloroflexi bacterium]|nr:hypothetical protein [Chloroflexota bacterium]